ncbi:hypothetical protein [Geomicrobium sp. JCM 19038]|uniref:hypothetical protein n=1 Tax=Geomicrobium sp. JCM 19038 TaxID=1460635 RepID=UPI00045F4AC4|nr:hypothetical protein [Geomicrobium sp. JCM 19038]GAK09149.1 hypothetical protein JCM19038_2970 [Geomicrobium sp. JCM 19038]
MIIIFLDRIFPIIAMGSLLFALWLRALPAFMIALALITLAVARNMVKMLYRGERVKAILALAIYIVSVVVLFPIFL